MKKTTTTLILCLIFLSSCNNREFERKFYQKVDEAQINAIKKGVVYFDLSEITNFEWDSVLLVRGNESVPVGFYEIDEMLNGRKSYIHWEKRIKGEVDTTFRWQTKNLPVNKDRFYFLTPDKKLIVKEIKSGIHKHKPAFVIKHCNENYWLSKEECKFKAFTNTKTKETGTVRFETNCIETR